jgi:hypothetical protein
MLRRHLLLMTSICLMTGIRRLWHRGLGRGLMVGPVWMLLVMMVKSGYPQSEALFMVICISVSMLAEMPKARILHNGIQALNLRYGLC